MSLIDISANSSHYLYWKSIGTVNEDLNFDFRVQRVQGVVSLLVQINLGFWETAHLPLPLPNIFLSVYNASYASLLAMYL